MDRTGMALRGVQQHAEEDSVVDLRKEERTAVIAPLNHMLGATGYKVAG